MASIRKIENKNGISYKIIVSIGRDANGKKITKSTTYKPDCSLTEKQQKNGLALAAIQFENECKKGSISDNENLLFETFSNDWLTRIKKTVSYKTSQDYQIMLDKKISPYFKGYKLDKITPALIEAYCTSLVNKNYSKATIVKHQRILDGIFELAVKWQYIDKNPCKVADIPKVKSKPKGLSFFTPEQSLTFLNSLDMEYITEYKAHTRIDDTGKSYKVNDYTETRHMSTQFKVFFHIALFCGLRRGEILALHWNDIVFDNKEINITKSVSYSPNGLIFKEPKTDESIRNVPMPDEVISILRKYKFEYNTMKMSLGDAWQGNDNLFVQWNGELMGLSTPRQKFNKHIKYYNKWVEAENSNGESPNIKPLPLIPLHGLRHSCATLLNYLGVNIIDIAKILGHSQTSTTMDIYAHSFEKQTRVACDKINEFLISHK